MSDKLTLSQILNKLSLKKPKSKTPIDFWPVVVGDVWKCAADAYLAFHMDPSPFQIQLAACVEKDGVRHICIVLHNSNTHYQLEENRGFKIFAPQPHSIKWPLPRFQPQRMTRQSLVRVSMSFIPEIERGVMAALHRIDERAARKNRRKREKNDPSEI